MKLVHSTSLKNFIAILNGSYDKPVGVWNVSYGDDLMYFHHVVDSIRAWGDNDIDLEGLLNGGEIPQLHLNEWGWHGRMQLVHECTESSTESVAVTFVVDVPESHYDMVHVDVSSIGMDSCRTIPVDEFDVSWIERIYISPIPVVHYPFIMSTIVRNDMAVLEKSDVYDMAVLISRSSDMYELYCEFEYQYNEISLQRFKMMYNVST